MMVLMVFPVFATAPCSDPDYYPHDKKPSPPQWKIDGLIAALEDSCEDTRTKALNTLSYLLFDTELTVAVLSPQTLRSIALLLKSQNPNTRAQAAITIGRIKKPAVSIIPDIIPLLGDEEYSVRKSAANALGLFCADAEPFITDIAAYLKDERPDVRRFALMALGNIGEHARAVIPDIVTFLNDTSSILRHLALKALVNAPNASREYIQAVAPFLSDKSINTRNLAVQFMGAMGEDARQYVSKITALLYYDSRISQFNYDSPDSKLNYEMTISIAEALEKIGVYDSLVLSGLVEMLQDSSSIIRRAAIIVFRKIGIKSAEILPAIASLFENDSPKIRYSALYTISGFKHHALPFTKKIAVLLSDSNAEVRSTAVKVLGELSDSSRQYIPDIIRLLKDDAQIVRIFAIYTLDSLMDSTNAAYTPMIATLLNDTIPHVHIAAAMTLARMGAQVQPYIPKIVSLLANDIDRFFDENGSIAKALSLMGEHAEAAVPLIIDLYRREDDLKQTRLRSTLVRMEKATIKHKFTIAPMLADTSPECRLLALDVLGSMGEQASVFATDIVPLLWDFDRQIRGAAIRALKKIGGNAFFENIPFFAVMLGDRTEYVRNEACYALNGCGEAIRPYLPFLMSLLSDTTCEFNVYPLLVDNCQYDLPLVCRLLEKTHEQQKYDIRLIARLTAGSNRNNQFLISLLGNPCCFPVWNLRGTITCSAALTLLNKTLYICDSLHLQKLRNEAEELVITITDRIKLFKGSNRHRLGFFDRIKLKLFRKSDKKL